MKFHRHDDTRDENIINLFIHSKTERHSELIHPGIISKNEFNTK